MAHELRNPEPLGAAAPAPTPGTGRIPLRPPVELHGSWGSLGRQTVAGRRRGGPATAAAAAAVWTSAVKPDTGPGAVAAGGCCALPLPLAGTCAGDARAAFAAVAVPLAVPADLAGAGEAAAGRLAAETLYLGGRSPAAGAPLAGTPEIWLYLRRGQDGGWHLVCTLFEPLTGGRADGPQADLRAREGAAGRCGLAAGLPGGQGGCHLTRSRLGGWRVPGSAVWFSQPVPPAVIPERMRRSRLPPSRAARALEASWRTVGWARACSGRTARRACRCFLSAVA
jgi:hypothetical protein